MGLRRRYPYCNPDPEGPGGVRGGTLSQVVMGEGVMGQEEMSGLTKNQETMSEEPRDNERRTKRQ